MVVAAWPEVVVSAVFCVLILTQVAWTWDRTPLLWLPAAVLFPAMWAVMAAGEGRYLGVLAALAGLALGLAHGSPGTPARQRQRWDVWAARAAWGMSLCALALSLLAEGAAPVSVGLALGAIAIRLVSRHWRVVVEKRPGRWLAWSGGLWWWALAVCSVAAVLAMDGRAQPTPAHLWVGALGLAGWCVYLWLALALLYRWFVQTSQQHTEEQHRLALQVCELRMNAVIEDGQSRMQEILDRKREFLATMSHELRTPISCIAGMSRLLANSSEVSETLRKDMGTVERLAVQLLGTVDGGLAFVRRESGGDELKADKVRMRWLLRDLKVVGGWLAQQNRNTFEFYRLSDLPSRLYFDEQRMRQVLINLLSNAARYCQGGTIFLSVKYGSSRQWASCLVWYVEDTGRGMSDDEIKKFSQPFVKSRDSLGLGLGLPLVKRMIQEMGGDLSIRSLKKLGTRVRLSVPVRLERADAAELVADDDEDASNASSVSHAYSAPMVLLPMNDMGVLDLNRLRVHVKLGQITEIEGWVERAKKIPGLSPVSHMFVARMEKACQVLDLQLTSQLLDQFDSPASFV